jgi:hypothetical protein
MGFDDFSWCRQSMEEFKVFSRCDDIIGVIGYSVDIGEDMVKVNGISAEEVKPFGLKKLRD